MATPQGNFAAFKELKYRKEDQDQSVDFINAGIDRLIKEGRARDAAKMKAAQEQGKGYYDMLKDIKIDPTTTISAWQDHENRLFNETVDTINEAKIKSLDVNIPVAEKQRLTQKALQMQTDYLQMKTFLGTKDQLDAFQKKLETDTSKIFKGDKGLKIMTAIKSNAMTVGYDKNGRAVVKYLDPDDNTMKEMSFSEATQAALNPYEEELVYKKDGLYDQMKTEATTMTIEKENGIGGNRTTKSFVFNPEEAKKSFDTRFGDYNLNNPDKYLEQFAFDVLNGGEIKNKEDWNKVKQAYVDKMDGYVKAETSTVDKYTAAQLEGQGLANENTKAKTAKIKKSMEENKEPVVANEQVSYIKQYNSKGQYVGHSSVNGSTVVIPGTQNTFTAVPFMSTDGNVYNKYFIGGITKQGRISNTEIQNPAATIKTFGKNTDAIKIMAEAIKGTKNITPISSANPITINPKGSTIDLDIQEAQIAPKAKSNTRDVMKDFINSSLDQ